jgi:HSP20 family protein
MKTMTLYRPGAIQNALSDLDHYFDSFFGNSVLAPSAKRVFNFLPAVDIRETKDAYLLEMELPGLDEKDIEIHIDNGKLSIASKQEEVKEASHENATSKEGAPSKEGGEKVPPEVSASPSETWLLKERRVSSFSRTFKLPENVNPEEVSAEFKNGVLSLEIKKRADAQRRAIQINVK